MKVTFLEEAVTEAEETRARYALRYLELALDFDEALSVAITEIKKQPERWPSYMHGTRRYMLRRFPYAVVYRVAQAQIQIIAIAHFSRKPGYWFTR